MKRDSARTRAAIAAAAATLFAERGYSGTTVRAIAAAAGCNPSLINRYCGGKAELFAAVMSTHVRSPAGISDDLTAGARARGLIRHMLDLGDGLTDAERTDRINLMFRTATKSDLIGELMGQIVAAPLARFVEGPDAQLRTMLLMSQLFGLAMLRDAIRVPELVDAPRQKILFYLAPGLAHLIGPVRAFPG